jgi:hypothetical protein
MIHRSVIKQIDHRDYNKAIGKARARPEPHDFASPAGQPDKID